MTNNLLLNPQNIEKKVQDKKTQVLFEKTINFFEHKGNFSMRTDSNRRLVPTDYYNFIKESGLFATLLTPAGYGDGDARWDHYRLSAFNELLGYYGMYQYTLQVSVLGVGPIWISKNEKQKKELAQQLKDGHVFAFGMSERDHGADLYSNEAKIMPMEDGRYIANGEKYYIGNSSRAPKISIFGKNAKTDEYVTWVVDSRERHYNYCGDIEVAGMFQGQLGYFEMVEYPITESEILETGDDSFAMGLATVNIGKTQTSIARVGMATHMLYEAINHSHNRYLYGNKVTDMPHIRRGFLEAWSRIVMSRLYCYRSADYFRQANKETDRRYIMFNAIQKARAAAQCEAAVIIMHNIMAAKAYETNTFAEIAVRNTGNSVRLEGTAHVNMGQAVKFLQNYFNNNVDIPEVPDGKMVKDDSSSMFDQGFGEAKNIKFDDYRKSFKSCELANVNIFLAQAEALKNFNNNSPLSKKQTENCDFMLNVAEIFGVVVYGQLVYEKSRIEKIDLLVVDQLFSYLVRDVNIFVMRQLNEYSGHFDDKQKENLFEIIKDPDINFQREESILEEYIFALDGAYVSRDS